MSFVQKVKNGARRTRGQRLIINVGTNNSKFSYTFSSTFTGALRPSRKKSPPKSPSSEKKKEQKIPIDKQETKSDRVKRLFDLFYGEESSAPNDIEEEKCLLCSNPDPLVELGNANRFLSDFLLGGRVEGCSDFVPCRQTIFSSRLLHG
ncbi:hypothetical protein NPIL_525331 [Nephila pilipes]|uniref:Uncharacterized protein n=1 Tax=Nephila pilipes TaxID=299642 RepID=A0A8X6NNV5_NEPPI|nr:hypothetical protein NPIL_525331 [Nephila pilipes]